MNSFVFGPVPSRRFGRSIGVNPVPFKICNYSCIYCQLGRTRHVQSERCEYFKTSEVVDELRSSLEACHGCADFVTFMGEGEPTLATNLGDMASEAKDFWKGGMALITNGSMFFSPEVRKAAMKFDIISPTIAAGDEKTYRRLHRPHRLFTLDKMLEGLKEFRRDFPGEIWAEVMLVRDVNDSFESLQSIRSAVLSIGADRTFIATPIRPPAEDWVLPPEKEAVDLALELLPGAEDMTYPESGEFTSISEDPVVNILTIAVNHPLREDQVEAILSGDNSEDDIIRILNGLIEEGKLERRRYGGTVFYRAPSTGITRSCACRRPPIK